MRRQSSTFVLSGIYLRGWGPRGPWGPRSPAGFFGAQGSEAPSGAEVKFSTINCNFNGFNDINCPPPPTPTPSPQKSALTSPKLLRIIWTNQEFRGPRGPTDYRVGAQGAQLGPFPNKKKSRNIVRNMKQSGIIQIKQPKIKNKNKIIFWSIFAYFVTWT